VAGVTPEEIGTHKDSLARTLRRLRSERDLSQVELGRATGISSSFLSLVEQGRSDITIGRLLRIAAFYDVELMDLLGDDDAAADPVQVLRADPERMIHSDADGVDLFELAAGRRWSLVPALGVVEGGSEVAVEGVTEREAMLFVLDGSFEIEVGGNAPVHIKRGEGALYLTGGSFRCRNVGRATGRLLNVFIRHRPSP
jgi:transcriptional regulator with XRE-family HTH domain